MLLTQIVAKFGAAYARVGLVASEKTAGHLTQSFIYAFGIFVSQKE